MKSSILKIEGMSCAGCAASVEKALINLKGVENASVNLSSGTAEVQYDEQTVDVQNFGRAIGDAGYKLKSN